ncbi:RNA polymerase sigma factor [Streptomyces sp. NPDC054904]|uniref:RNA polymerase sigma factor n=1 Tax=unclassified Streptomyces TaxID=2593676 RepID=UPI002481DF9A|nr:MULTISPECIES: RNA polymerase sigma factor [unclassified Streptomyces]MDA5279996.1 RNA polymerase sigma factor [Streptomyces sp. Isolate_45]MDX2391166.1 RNA polymerase sigma factor [Streptomyces sp. DK15]
MDQQLFAEIYDAHARAVYAHAVRMSFDRAAAEDIVSLTFLEAWRLRATLDNVTSHRAWLLGVATNVMRNTRRAARRHSAAMSRLPLTDPIADPADEVVSRITDRARAVATLAALDRLRRSDREVIALSVWSGLSHAEIAGACGIAEASVRSRLSRARSRLRELTAAALAADPTSGQVSVSRIAREGHL